MGWFRNLMRKNQELEGYIERIESNMANNYKDNAQDYLKKLEGTFEELKENGALNDKQKAYYESVIYNYKERMKGFTHKDQKPFWT